MSAFELDDVQAATVEEALAFLDACDSPEDLALLESDACVSPDAQSWLAPFQELMAPAGFDALLSDDKYANAPYTSSETSAHAQASHDKLPDDAPLLPARQVKHYKKTREANVKAVTKYRERKRSEIAELHLLVKKLTAQLARLLQQNEDAVKQEQRAIKQEEGQQCGGEGDASSSKRSPSSREAALLEAAKLRKAKLLNRKLREVLGSHSDLNKTLQSQVQRQISDHRQELMLVLESHIGAPSTVEKETPKLEEKRAAAMPECKEQVPPVAYGLTTHAQEGAGFFYPASMPKSKDTSVFTKSTFQGTTGGEILSYTARQIAVSIPTDLVKKEPKLDNTPANVAPLWNFGHLGKFLRSRALNRAVARAGHLVLKPQTDEPKDLKAELTASLAYEVRSVSMGAATATNSVLAGSFPIVMAFVALLALFRAEYILSGQSLVMLPDLGASRY